ncbi:hypothetical protein EN745_15380 [Mesorhizobium sp. M4A.F.Ca.ET.022.05.2.1]|nr:hypothetical protein EN745_15380 [Mesorhizobium sp. M4A.F.Ca.ET.022.05.2.1]
MAQTRAKSGLALAEIAQAANAPLPPRADASMRLLSGANLDMAHSWHLAYFDDVRYVDALRTIRAGACLVSERFAHLVPKGTAPIIVQHPRLANARILAQLHPQIRRSGISCPGDLSLLRWLVRRQSRSSQASAGD